jgi:hypothetical protein
VSPVSALAFIAAATVKNLLKRQARRVREPRYLLATLFGLFYVWSLFVRPGLGTRRIARRGPLPELEISIRGDGLTWAWMLILLFGWIFGGDESGLTFTEAEIQFLFPAPLSRRQLVHYKLARTLLFASFTALILTATIGRTVGAGSPLFVLGAFLGVGTISLHLVAASLTRLSLLERGLGGSARRALALVVPAAIVGSLIGGFLLVPDPWPERWREVKPYLAHLCATAPMWWVSLPLAPAVHVAQARSTAEILRWLPPALGVLGVHYLWALSTGVAFEQASVHTAERRGRRLEGMRRGHLTVRASARPPFALSAEGPPAVAIYWKNLTAAVRVLSLRMAMILVLPTLAGAVAILATGAAFNRELGAVLCLVMAVSTAIFGAQVYRIDFRLDLASMDLLKSFPLRGVDLAAAEVLAPFTVLALTEWIFLAGAAVLAPAGVVAITGRLPLLAAAMVALPALTLPALLVQNAAALLFPAWVESGAAPPRGIEAIGQRMLTLIGTLLAVGIALVPAAVVGGIAGALLWQPLGGAALPIAALAGAAVVGGEAVLAFFGLGRAFERFDPGRQ